jgi:hypothetical protein
METPNEYTLTADEKGMLDELTSQIQFLQNEAQSVLRGIMRFRRLAGEGWNLDGGTLKRPQPEA